MLLGKKERKEKEMKRGREYLFQTLRKSIGKNEMRDPELWVDEIFNSHETPSHTFASVLKQDTEQAVGTLIFHICNEQTTNYFLAARELHEEAPHRRRGQQTL